MEFNSINETFNNVMKTEDLSEDEINELEIELRNIENENSKSSNLNNSNNNSNNNLIKETDSFLNNIISIYGNETSKNLLEVNYENENLNVSGYISKPSLTRAIKSDQSLYVNDRFIKDNIIA